MPQSIQEPGSIIVRARTDLRVSLRSERGVEFHFIEDPVRNTFFRLGKAEYAVFAALDGRRPLSDAVAVAACRNTVDALNLEQSLALAKWLIDSGLASNEASESKERFGRHAAQRRQSRWSRINPWYVRLALPSPERWLDRLSSVGTVLFGRPFFIAWLTAIVSAAFVIVGDWAKITAHSPLVLGWQGAIQFLVIWCLLKLLHELAHALACRHVGGTVGNVGVAFVLGMPSPFVDVTSVWRQSNRNARILVSLAGIYVELFIAALSILLWSWSGDGVIRQTALATAMVAGVSTLVFNLNPLMRFDGYFALADWVDFANLATLARQQSLKFLRRYFLGTDLPLTLHSEMREPRWLVAYGLAAILWRAFVVVGLLSLALYKFGPVVAGCLSLIPVVPWVRQVYGAVRKGSRTTSNPTNWRRLCLTWTSTAALAASTFYYFDPRVIDVPAVVDYEPLAVVRIAAPGFVREVLASDGQQVEQGQPLVKLANEELDVELAQTRLVAQQHLAKARMYRQSGAIAKEQSELGQLEALEVKIKELERQRESLTIRAPVSGQIVSRGLAHLAGQWLDEGAEVLSVGNESAKQVVAALVHSDAEALKQSRGEYSLQLSGTRQKRPIVDLHLDPRAQVDLVHSALSVEHGGNIPVRRRDASDGAANDKKILISEFYEPHFRLTGALDVAAAEQIAAGRTAQLRVQTTWRGAASRWWSHWSRWLDGRTSPARDSQASSSL